MRFFKNGSNGRNGKFLLEMGGGQEVALEGGRGFGFIMGDGNFLVSLHSWQRGSNPPFL